jgi:hypothetical protein
MLNSIFAWFCILGLVVGSYLLGVVLERKLEPAQREPGSRLLRRF